MIKYRKDLMDCLDSNSKQKREVFARYGLAMHYAQCIEKSLAMLISSVFNKEFMPSSPQVRNDFYNQAFSKTLGSLIKKLEKKITIPPNLNQDLNYALDKRNWLAHEYFYDRPGEIHTPEGRNKMINELSEIYENLRKIDDRLELIIDKWVKNVGIKDELIKDMIKKLIEKSRKT